MKRVRHHQRPLWPQEKLALPPRLGGLLALDACLINAPHPLAKIAEIFGFGKVIMVRGRNIYWPILSYDLSRDPAELALLAHELVHVWQYRQGMTIWRYLWRERGIYSYKLIGDKPFVAYGYEQQAAMVEDYVRLVNGLKTRHALESVTIHDLEALMPEFTCPLMIPNFG